MDGEKGTMLELRNYSPAELAGIIGTSTEKQQITRKLNRLGVGYKHKGWGSNGVYTLQSIADPFKLFCILDLEISTGANFDKIRNLYYYLFCVDGFAEMPMSEMEFWLAETDIPVSRQTISRWIKHLQDLNFFAPPSNDNAIYYKIEIINGIKVHTEIDRETYRNAWKIYFEEYEPGHSDEAYWKMRNFLGGHPYKKYRLTQNVLKRDEINYLISLINDTFPE